MAQKKSDSSEPAKQKVEGKENRLAFPVIGLGASAGGLEALERFFEAVSENSGAAYVVVAHLDPTHISLMPELLQKHTKIATVQIKDGMSVESDHLYIIPPNCNLSILNGRLQLLELPEKRSSNLPIDHFFKALAQDRGSSAVAVILSGTGSDGTLGIKAIKAECGLVTGQSH